MFQLFICRDSKRFPHIVQFQMRYHNTGSHSIKLYHLEWEGQLLRLPEQNARIIIEKGFAVLEEPLWPGWRSPASYALAVAITHIRLSPPLVQNPSEPTKKVSKKKTRIKALLFWSVNRRGMQEKDFERSFEELGRRAVEELFAKVRVETPFWKLRRWRLLLRESGLSIAEYIRHNASNCELQFRQKSGWFLKHAENTLILKIGFMKIQTAHSFAFVLKSCFKTSFRKWEEKMKRCWGEGESEPVYIAL